MTSQALIYPLFLKLFWFKWFQLFNKTSFLWNAGCIAIYLSKCKTNIYLFQKGVSILYSCILEVDILMMSYLQIFGVLIKSNFLWPDYISAQVTQSSLQALLYDNAPWISHTTIFSSSLSIFRLSSSILHTTARR